MNFKKLSLGFIWVGVFFITISCIWWAISYDSYIENSLKNYEKVVMSVGISQESAESIAYANIYPNTVAGYTGCLFTNTYTGKDSYGNAINQTCTSLTSYSPISLYFGFLMLILGVIIFFSVQNEKKD